MRAKRNAAALAGARGADDHELLHANPTVPEQGAQRSIAIPPPDIATEINAAHKAAERDLRSSVDHAIRCGNLLLQAKASLKHGEWEPWITHNLKVSPRSVRGYVRLAMLAGTKGQRVADLSLRQALKEIGQN